jgi:hypothetical protein
MTDSATIVRVTHSFGTSQERAYDAWLKPDVVGTWMFGPRLRDEEVIHLKTDPRVGGTFSFLVKRLGVAVDHVETYRVVRMASGCAPRPSHGPEMD